MLEFAAGCGDEALREQLYALDAKGYRQQAETGWSGRVCWSRFDAWRRAWAGYCQRLSSWSAIPALIPPNAMPR